MACLRRLVRNQRAGSRRAGVLRRCKDRLRDGEQRLQRCGQQHPEVWRRVAALQPAGLLLQPAALQPNDAFREGRVSYAVCASTTPLLASDVATYCTALQGHHIFGQPTLALAASAGKHSHVQHSTHRSRANLVRTKQAIPVTGACWPAQWPRWPRCPERSARTHSPTLKPPTQVVLPSLHRCMASASPCTQAR